MKQLYPFTVSGGYLVVKGMPVHRKAMEDKLGRKLKRSEVVHHIDYNRHNNSIENLAIVTSSEHTRIHKTFDVHDYPSKELSREEKIECRIDSVDVWIMEKVKRTKRGDKSYRYYMASWREGPKTRNVHIGSVMKISREDAITIAKELKAKSLKMP